MKPKFFDGCKVKIQNLERGYDGRIGILQAFGPKTNKESKENQDYEECLSCQ